MHAFGRPILASTLISIDSARRVACASVVAPQAAEHGTVGGSPVSTAQR